MPFTSNSFRTKAQEQLSPPLLSGGRGDPLTAPALWIPRLVARQVGVTVLVSPTKNMNFLRSQDFLGAGEKSSRIHTNKLRKGRPVRAQDAHGGVETGGPNSVRLQGHG